MKQSVILKPQLLYGIYIVVNFLIKFYLKRIHVKGFSVKLKCCYHEAYIQLNKQQNWDGQKYLINILQRAN